MTPGTKPTGKELYHQCSILLTYYHSPQVKFSCHHDQHDARTRCVVKKLSVETSLPSFRKESSRCRPRNSRPPRLHSPRPMTHAVFCPQQEVLADHVAVTGASSASCLFAASARLARATLRAWAAAVIAPVFHDDRHRHPGRIADVPRGHGSCLGSRGVPSKNTSQFITFRQSSYMFVCDTTHPACV